MLHFFELCPLPGICFPVGFLCLGRQHMELSFDLAPLFLPTILQVSKLLYLTFFCWTYLECHCLLHRILTTLFRFWSVWDNQIYKMIINAFLEFRHGCMWLTQRIWGFPHHLPPRVLGYSVFIWVRWRAWPTEVVIPAGRDFSSAVQVGELTNSAWIIITIGLVSIVIEEWA